MKAERPVPSREAILTYTQRWGLLGVFLLIFAGFSAWLPGKFATSGNLQDILTSQPPGIFIAFAAVLVLAVGEFDLSLGAIVGLSQYLVLNLITSSHVSWPVAVVLSIAAGIAVGAINAALVVGVGIDSFIATIGVATVLGGLLEWISNENVPIFGGAPKGLTEIAQTKLLGLALPVWYGLVAAIALWLLLEYTVFGRELRATGVNRIAAGLSGIRTNRSRVFAFLVAGALCGVAGVLATARIGAADATSGPSYLLPAYAAAFLGASAIRPGFFNIWGTVIAIFLVAVGITGLQLDGVASWVTPVFNGAALLIAVAVSNLAARHNGSGSRRLVRDPELTNEPRAPAAADPSSARSYLGQGAEE